MAVSYTHLDVYKRQVDELTIHKAIGQTVQLAFAEHELVGIELLCLGGGHDAPHLVEGVHIEGQVVDLAVIVGDRAGYSAIC